MLLISAAGILLLLFILYGAKTIINIRIDQEKKQFLLTKPCNYQVPVNQEFVLKNQELVCIEELRLLYYSNLVPPVKQTGILSDSGARILVTTKDNDPIKDIRLTKSDNQFIFDAEGKLKDSYTITLRDYQPGEAKLFIQTTVR